MTSSNIELATDHTNSSDQGSTSIADIESGRLHCDRGGVLLTWEDLWVNVVNSHRKEFILQGISGCAKPGQVLAIMGPSGCGKSTLLDALTGRLGANTRLAGDILVNGRKQELAYGTSAYVTQDDTLITSLTVKETLYYCAQLQLPNSMSQSEKKERADMTIKEMGLQGCINTRIGGSWGPKGLSHGQKRRVSICIDILTRPYLLVLDEPTSGLDSAASYYVMSRITNLDRRERRTVIVSIHQPSSEVFGLFHNLCLLSMGKLVYFGPASTANGFFASNGFPCPIMHCPSDHFLKTINKDFDEDMEEGYVNKKPTEEVIDILVTSYKSSGYYQEIQRQISATYEHEGATLEKSEKQASFINQCIILTKRSYMNMNRDIGYYWMRLFIYIGLAIGLGTIYINIGSSYSSIQGRATFLTFVSTFLTFMAIAGFPSFVEDMKVFRRERLNGHYHSSAFVIANTLSSVPYLFLISVIPGAITYYLTGLQRGFFHFIYFIYVLFVSLLMVESLMMVVASIVPNFLIGIIVGAGIQAIMILSAGYRLPSDLPGPFWKYPMYYIAFHRYAFEGMYKNEIEGLTFPSNQNGSGVIDDETILRDLWQMDLVFTKWDDLAVLFGMVVFYRFLFFGIIKIKENTKCVSFATMFIRAKRTTQIAEDPPNSYSDSFRVNSHNLFVVGYIC